MHSAVVESWEDFRDHKIFHYQNSPLVLSKTPSVFTSFGNCWYVYNIIIIDMKLYVKHDSDCKEGTHAKLDKETESTSIQLHVWILSENHCVKGRSYSTNIILLLLLWKQIKTNSMNVQNMIKINTMFNFVTVFLPLPSVLYTEYFLDVFRKR